MKNIKVHFKIDYENLTNEEKIYNKILMMCMNFEDHEIDCYPILPYYFEILNLDDSEFRDLFITSIGNKNLILGDILFNQGVDINHEDIIDSFKELCFYNQLEIIQYLLYKGFLVTTKIKNDIITEFENDFILGFSKRMTVDYVEQVWTKKRIDKINKLKCRIQNTQKIDDLLENKRNGLKYFYI